ncbi:DUF6538 domain-containing protein [Vibrio splendidus]
MHLVSRNNTYYFQRRIPKSIQSRYNGKQHLKFSLQTKDKRQALNLARKLSAQFDIEFETIQCANLPDFSNKFNTATSLQESTRLNLSSCVSDFIEAKRVDGISKKALFRTPDVFKTEYMGGVH